MISEYLSRRSKKTYHGLREGEGQGFYDSYSVKALVLKIVINYVTSFMCNPIDACGVFFFVFQLIDEHRSDEKVTLKF